MGDVHTRFLPAEGKCGYEGRQSEFAGVRCWERRASPHHKSLGEERHEDGREGGSAREPVGIIQRERQM